MGRKRGAGQAHAARARDGAVAGAMEECGALVTGLLVAEAAQTNEAVRCWAA